MGENEFNCSSKNGYENGCFEEDIYWSNFKSIRFFLFLSSDSFSQLMIPKKFSENMRNKLPQMTVLKSPGGAEWEVKLIWDNDTLFLRDGWKEFAKAHNFKAKDLLMFKYCRDSCFKVWAFNERDSCEKASSFFVKKSALGKHDAGRNSNSEIEGSDTEEASAGASRRNIRRQTVCGFRTSGVDGKRDAGENSNSKRKKAGENSELEGSDIEEANARASRKKTRRQSVCGSRKSGDDAKTPSKHCTPRKKTRRTSGVDGKRDAGENSNSKRKKAGENSELEGSDIEDANARASRKKTRRQSVCGSRKSGDDAKTLSKPCTPHREPPSEADKERALHMASRHVTKESFMVVLKIYNVSQYFRLGIPAQWARDNLAQKNQYMELHANGKSWTVRYNVQKYSAAGVLVSGWSTFVADNSLQVSDVCLFKLVSKKDELAVFDVRIWRAAPMVADQPSPPFQITRNET